MLTRAHLDLIRHALKSAPRIRISKLGSQAATVNGGCGVNSTSTTTANATAANGNSAVNSHQQQQQLSPPVLRKAAVFIPLCMDKQVPSVLYIRRSQTMRHHTGQIAFPGGIMEPGEELDPVRCALREMEEEVGITAEETEVLGVHHDAHTIERGNRPATIISPVVGFIKEDMYVK